MKTNDDLLSDIAQYNLEDDINKNFPIIWKVLTNEFKLSSPEKPVGILLGGQPGAGKSFATIKITEHLNNNVLVINGDEFRVYHKYYGEFYQLYGKDASKYTGEFAGRMVEKIRNEAIKQGLNVVIEGTFRTVDTPLKELHNLKNNGYEAKVIVCTCPKELSWDSTIKRAEELEASGRQPRYVPKEHHDLVTDNLAKNTSVIFNSGLASSLEIYSREARLFDSLSGNTNDIQKVINQELNRFSLKQNHQSNPHILFIDKLRELSQLSQAESELSQTQRLTKTKKFKR